MDLSQDRGISRMGHHEMRNQGIEPHASQSAEPGSRPAAIDGSGRRLIFDVGMHRGEDTEFYLQKDFDVVAVEAVPDFCEEVAARFQSEVDSGRLVIVNAAVAEQPGQITFYLNPVSVWGTIRANWSERNSRVGSPSDRQITVSAIRFEEVLAKYGVPYYLKIDIEGADLLCLLALNQFDPRPRYVSVESNKTSWRALVEEFDLLRSLGYRRFKVVAQQRVPRQRCPKPAREGTYVNHEFTHGMSGLFGAEAPGRYVGRSLALLHYRFIFLRYWLYGDAGVMLSNPKLRFLAKVIQFVLRGPGWYDTHAR